MKKFMTFILMILFLASLALAADSTYTTKVYHKQGGDEEVVADGGQITVESGGEIEIESGGIIDVESGGYFKIAGTAVTSSATELNKLASIGSGDVLTTTNTKEVSGKTIAGLWIKAVRHVFTVVGNWALSAAEQLCALLVAASGSGSITLPAGTADYSPVYIVRNETSGDVTVGIAGSAVTIATGKTAVVVYDPTTADYVRVTADATH